MGLFGKNKNKKKKEGEGGRLLLPSEPPHWTYGRLLLRLSRTHCNRPPAPQSGLELGHSPLFLKWGETTGAA